MTAGPTSMSETRTPGPRRRVLFIAEAVTLAHVARTCVLAGGFDPSRYDVHVAWDPRYNALLGELPFPFHPIRTVPTEVFLRRVARGVPLHDVRELRENVAEDTTTIERVRPDAVVGDFRMSLAASARLCGVPLVTVSNAYWSPYGRQTFLFDEYDYPLTGLVGRRTARLLFRVFRPVGFAAHVRPLNRVLRERSLPPIGGDIRDMYTFGDRTVYADLPQLVPTYDLPSSHCYIGAVLWSPAVSPPSWWNALPSDRPAVYVTPGSSGERGWLPIALEALADLPVTVMAATAGQTALGRVPVNARLAEYLPGSEAAARSSLVISNGGSPTTYQALAAGVPVLGIAGNNMDQHLNMVAVHKAGAGKVLRARGITAAEIRAAVHEIMGIASYKQAAEALAEAYRSRRGQRRLEEVIDELVEKAAV